MMSINNLYDFNPVLPRAYLT